MAKDKSNGHAPQKTDAKSPFHGFVNYNLSEADKAKFHEFWRQSNTDNWGQYLNQLIDNGYKISLSYDNYNTAYSATMMCMKVGHPDQGWCLSGKGPDITTAIEVLFFKHFDLLKEKWVENAKSISAQKGDIA